MLARRYRGRFAPSPTGPLHFGSLVAALGSFLQARRAGGQWLVRIEDLDTPRNEPGAADAQLRTLERFGLCWDGAVTYQSARLDHYRASLAALAAEHLTFACGCTRREVGRGPYPGACRDGLPPGKAARSVRLRVDGAPTAFDDMVQGRFEQRLATTVGDFVVHRADGIHAYHLAVVVDDAAQAITEIVRGADLLDSTPRQIYLQRCLAAASPRYAHLPVAVNALGQKLSKQTGARAIDVERPGTAIAEALAFLGQAPPPGLREAGAEEALEWGIANWHLDNVPRVRHIVHAP